MSIFEKKWQDKNIINSCSEGVETVGRSPTLWQQQGRVKLLSAAGNEKVFCYFQVENDE